MTHSYVWRDSFVCVTWRIHACDVTHSCVSHDAFIRVTWLTPKIQRAMRAYTGLMYMCDMTRSHVQRDSFTRVTLRIHMCDVTYPQNSNWTHSHNSWEPWGYDHDPFIHKRDLTHSYVQRDSFISATWRIHTCNVTHNRNPESHACTHTAFTVPRTHSHVWHHAFICGTRTVYTRDLTHCDSLPKSWQPCHIYGVPTQSHFVSHVTCMCMIHICRPSYELSHGVRTRRSVCVCMCVYVDVCARVCARIYVHVCDCMCLCVCVYVCMRSAADLFIRET